MSVVRAFHYNYKFVLTYGFSCYSFVVKHFINTIKCCVSSYEYYVLKKKRFIYRA